MEILHTTAAVPADRRLAYWQDALSRTFTAVDVRVPDGGDCRGTIRTSRLGPVQVTRVEGGAMRVQRPERPAASGPDEPLVVMSVVKGAVVVENDDRVAHLHPGDTLFFDMTRPLRVDFGSVFHVTCLLLPQRLLGLTDSGLRQLMTTPIRPDTPSGSLLSPLLIKLGDTVPTLSSGTGESLVRHVVDLFSILTEERLHRESGDAPGAARYLLPRIQAFIDGNLADPDLTPDSIAHAHRISVRYLHKLFEHEDTTVNRWIRRRRLQECRRELARRGTVDRTISAVARRWGFTSASHFSRAFRAMYGMSPAEWRSSAVRQPGVAAPGDMSTAQTATTELRFQRPGPPSSRREAEDTAA
ncbi:helix-turn-helix domain-containing protein [Streptomyces sp. NPDC014991]|uniref:helix-turn-helix domain-containing protein n=1 Tax=Streptomyces sp. NPDC014991 TaxID=3364935 RepID=UPI0036F71DBE